MESGVMRPPKRRFEYRWFVLETCDAAGERLEAVRGITASSAEATRRELLRRVGRRATVRVVGEYATKAEALAAAAAP